MNIIFPLCTTLAVETGIYMILKHRSIKLFLLVSIMNAIFHTGINIMLSSLEGNYVYYIVLAFAEFALIYVESTILYLTLNEKYIKVIGISCLANLASLLITFICRGLYQTKVAIYIVMGVFIAIYVGTFVTLLVLHHKRIY